MEHVFGHNVSIREMWRCFHEFDIPAHFRLPVVKFVLIGPGTVFIPFGLLDHRVIHDI